MRNAPRLRSPLTLCLSVLLLSSCSRLRQTCEGLGLVDPPPSPSVVVDVYCDPSEGSSCNVGTLGRTLDVVLLFAAERPGSTVRLWAQGERYEETGVLAEVTSPVTTPASPRGIRYRHAQFVEQARRTLLRGMRPCFTRRRSRRSPIAEGLAKVALSRRGTCGERFIVVISDGREVSSFGNFESRSLPRPTAFVERLHGEHVLLPGSLAGAKLFFTYLDSNPTPNGCPMTISRALGIEQLWRATTQAAGAHEVSFSRGPVTLADQAKGKEAKR